MTNEMIDIALSKLVRSDKNVRTINISHGQEELQASILAKGILKNFVVYETAKGKYAVADGERRRTALKALVKTKEIPANFPVACLVRPEEEAIELGLMANITSLAMHPADQFEAFAALLDEGKPVEDVAAHFGITPAIVTRRMKLARVAPVIFQAYRAEKLPLDAVMAFTVTESQTEQEQVYSEILQRNSGFSRAHILRMLTHDKVPTDDPRFRYVGEDTYLAAGGAITRDLFDEEGGGYATDSALIDRLALEKLTLNVPAILAEGWKWVEPVLSYSYEMRRGFAQIQAKPQTLSAEDDARKATLAARSDEIVEECEGYEPDEGPLLEEYRRIEAELEEIASRESAYDPAEIAVAGGWLTLDSQGQPDTELGHVRREDVSALDALRRATSLQAVDETVDRDGDGHAGPDDEDDQDGEGVTPLPSPVQASGLSDALLTDLHAARTVALRLELANRPDIALRAVAYSLAGKVVAHETGVLTISVREVYTPAISKSHCPDDDAVQNRLKDWRLRLQGRAGELWEAILVLPEADVLDLIAVCAAVAVDATHNKAGDFANRQRMNHADQLASTLQLDMTQHWKPTAEGFFGRVNKVSILEAVAEAAGESTAKRLDGLKKGIMAAEAEAFVSKKGWLPSVLRTKGQQFTQGEGEALAAE